MSLNEAPRASRLHIGIFGRTNSGKSSLVNALTGQQAALVSEQEGTTTDPVYKAMEIHGLGPCVFIDTAGFDDTGALGKLRVDAPREALKKTDIALLVLTQAPAETELLWLNQIKGRHIPVLIVLNKCDLLGGAKSPLSQSILEKIPESDVCIPVSARTGEGIHQLRQALIRAMPADAQPESITGNLAAPKDVVLLVMPQDIQAPQGRLILPQVQTIRDLLDKKCSVMCCTADSLEDTLSALAAPPSLIITDSQVFKMVYEKKPAASRLTSFSVLFAAYKGDADYFVQGARAIKGLTPASRVLIAEACTHAPLSEDIGREKIPAMLRRLTGGELTIEMVSGQDFPKDLSPYDLIIHCGACMFNRRYVLSRVEEAKAAHVPMTNYGMAIACLTGILDQIQIPSHKA